MVTSLAWVTPGRWEKGGGRVVQGHFWGWEGELGNPVAEP